MRNMRSLKEMNKIIKSIGTNGISFDCETPTKDDYYKTFLSDMVQTCIPMLEWKNLPDTIPDWQLNLYLQRYGFSIFTKHDGNYYVFYGGLGGVPNVYYQPTIATIANPYLKWSAQVELGKEAILMRNDRLRDGLLSWHSMYAYQMAEAMLSLRLGLVNSRAEYIISANDDSEAQGAKQFLDTLEQGIHLGSITHDTFLNSDTITTLPYSNASINTIRSGVEAIQYLYSAWARGVGIQSSFNTKREYVAIEATTQPEETVINRPYEMLKCAKDACKEINSLYSLNLSVDFGSIWKTRDTDIKLGEKILKKEAQEVEQEGKPESEEVKEDENSKTLQ